MNASNRPHAATRPPRISRRWLTLAARRLRTPELPDDAAELFAEIAQEQGGRAARRWYRQQVRSALARALWRTAPRTSLPPQRRGAPLTGLQLDAKLALRMLVRYPGLTFVGGVAIAFAIAVGAGVFEFINLTLPARDLPLPHGERVIGLRSWDLESNTPAPLDGATLRAWQTGLQTTEHVGAYRTVMRNLSADRQQHGPVEIAVMSPSGFDATGVRPVLGRPLTDADATPGAPAVAVVSHALWQTFFRGAPEALGRHVQLGTTDTVVVGVMPDGYGFPVHHNVWTPLSLDRGDEVMGGVRVFGRLMANATLAQAQAEADALTPRIQRPKALSDRRLVTQVLPYRTSLVDRPVSLLVRAIMLQVNIFAALFVLLVSANVALLMFARAAAREREFIVRTALGASRARVAMQLFIEALALSTIATLCGLAIVKPGLAWIAREINVMGGGTPPFWFLPRVSATTFAYAGGLAVLAAVMAGVVPALKATKRDVTRRLGQATAGGGGIRFGGIWTAVVITQIAATVIFSAGAALMVRQAWRTSSITAPFPVADYLTMRVDLDPDVAAAAPYRTLLRQFEQRLIEDPRVAGVTAGDGIPLIGHPDLVLDVQSRPAGAEPVVTSRSAVDATFFETFDARLIAGRWLTDGDLHGDARAVVVDKYFVDTIFGGRNAIGEHVRARDTTGRARDGGWLEIVGVVDNIEARLPQRSFLDPPQRAMLYHPVTHDEANVSPLVAIVRLRSGGDELRARLHQIASGVSPALRVHDIKTLAEAARAEVTFWTLWADMVLMVSGVALFLSLAGIYAATSFAVARRTREIGIRVALGASSASIAAGILSRPLTHVSAGVAVGSVLISVMFWLTNNDVGIREVAGLIALGAGIIASCTLACVVPMRRALRVQPTEALGAEL